MVRWYSSFKRRAQAPLALIFLKIFYHLEDSVVTSAVKASGAVHSACRSAFGPPPCPNLALPSAVPPRWPPSRRHPQGTPPCALSAQPRARPLRKQLLRVPSAVPPRWRPSHRHRQCTPPCAHLVGGVASSLELIPQCAAWTRDSATPGLAAEIAPPWQRGGPAAAIRKRERSGLCRSPERSTCPAWPPAGCKASH